MGNARRKGGEEREGGKGKMWDTYTHTHSRGRYQTNKQLMQFCSNQTQTNKQIVDDAVEGTQGRREEKGTPN